MTLVMDRIAGNYYSTLNDRACIAKEAAFFTADSQALLLDKFFLT